MNDLVRVAAEDLKLLRERKPLIHNVTNYVVMNYTANALLAMGASPVMAHAEEEVAEMVGLADALVLNIGTLSQAWIRAMFAAGQAANRKGIPVILDPVGAGATRLRTDTSRELLEKIAVTVVRGNASEVLALLDAGSRTKGVDSLHSVADAEQAAVEIARAHNCIVAVTGAVDQITDGVKSLRVSNGHPMMGKVTGTGCTATVAVASFCAIDQDYLRATALGLGFFGLAGEIAARKHTSPGSYGIGLIDALGEITPASFAAGLKVEE